MQREGALPDLDATDEMMKVTFSSDEMKMKVTFHFHFQLRAQAQSNTLGMLELLAQLSRMKVNFVWQGSAHHSTAPTVAM